MANRFLYLARHGEAVNDGELSPAGRRQALLLGQRLATAPMTAIHHSPLPRAKQTAALISHCLPDVPVHSSETVGDYLPPVPDRGALPEFVRHALDAPDRRWLGLNAGNCALTVILYRPDRPPALLNFNDMSHLPSDLRWTGFPPELRV